MEKADEIASLINGMSNKELFDRCLDIPVDELSLIVDKAWDYLNDKDICQRLNIPYDKDPNLFYVRKVELYAYLLSQ